MKMEFTKMHGTGNDYVYVNCMEQELPNPGAISEYISHRRFGIGSDGLIMICKSDVADFKMRIFNADASEAKMCGNGSRCIAKYVYDKGLTDKTEITLETNSGIKYLTLFPENGKVEFVEVDMGKAILTPKDIPVNSDKERFISEPVEVDGKEYKITCVSMGNPHAIVYMDDIKDLDLEKIGPSFENHKLFPDRINTEFIEVIDSHTLNMRVWERGSGETFACGTGACASVVASVLNGYCNHDEEVTVHLRGGDLKITWNSDGTVIMKGPAALICDGDIDVSHIK